MQACVLEYNGHQTPEGHDVGFSQALMPLNCLSYYFTVNVLDLGKKGYLAVGLTHRVKTMQIYIKPDFPLSRHSNAYRREAIVFLEMFVFPRTIRAAACLAGGRTQWHIMQVIRYRVNPITKL